MVREAREESGVQLSVDGLHFAHVMHRKANDERMDFFFTAEKWEGEPTNMEPEKCDDLSWFSLTQLPENTIPYIRYALEQYEAGNHYTEFGW